MVIFRAGLCTDFLSVEYFLEEYLSGSERLVAYSRDQVGQFALSCPTGVPRGIPRGMNIASVVLPLVRKHVQQTLMLQRIRENILHRFGRDASHLLVLYNYAFLSRTWMQCGNLASSDIVAGRLNIQKKFPRATNTCCVLLFPDLVNYLCCDLLYFLLNYTSHLVLFNCHFN